MSTAQLIGDRGGLPAETTSVALSRPEAARRLPLMIAGALLLVVLYAAFDHGAVALPVDARLQIVIAVIAAIGAAGWLAAGTIRLSAPRIAFGGVALLAAFALWSGVTLIWSVSPDQTWIELNRAVTYVIVVCLGIAIGASHARAVELSAKGFLAVALAVTAYALGQKLFPGLRVTGVFDLNQTGALPRLQEPLGYWNALALFIALGVPTALALAADATRSAPTRLASAAAVELMVLTIGLTYSRGGLLALAVALVVAVAAGGEARRTTLWLGLGILGAVPPLAYGLASRTLTTAGVGLGSREGAGAILAAVLAASLAALILGGRVLLALEPRLQMRPARARQARRWALTAVAVLVVGGVLAVGLSSRGLSGTVSHAWKSFTSTQTASNVNPSRLLSADSENRWVWWKEAARAFGDRPIGGWGAGSFGVVHLLYRRDTLPVQQPHSVPLQFLAETGVVGTLLAVTAFPLLVTAAVGGVRRHTQSGPERRLAAALLAAAVAYLVHALYDWDWNIPAVTLPALMFLGLLAGIGGGGARGRRELELQAVVARGGLPVAVRVRALRGAAEHRCQQGQFGARRGSQRIAERASLGPGERGARRSSRSVV